MRGLIAASDSHMGAILSDDLIFLAMGLLVVFASPSSSDDSPCLMGLSRLEWGSTSVFCAVTLFVEEIDYQVPIDFQLSSGEIFPVFIRPSDTQFITVRIFNLPPEIPNSTLQNVLSQYGTVQEIRYIYV
ncbi:hypothetical protein C0J52_23481 [Blattella germanica]|nr:hypothetical protein C0J52_23481 [Blattella germanica]